MNESNRNKDGPSTEADRSGTALSVSHTRPPSRIARQEKLTPNAIITRPRLSVDLKASLARQRFGQSLATTLSSNPEQCRRSVQPSVTASIYPSSVSFGSPLSQPIEHTVEKDVMLLNLLINLNERKYGGGGINV